MLSDIFTFASLSTSNSPVLNASLIFGCRLVTDVDSQCAQLAFHDLTPPEITAPPGISRLLGLGLKFCPTPRQFKVDDYISHFSTLHRNIRLRLFFGSDEGNIHWNRRLYVANRSWNPPDVSPQLEDFFGQHAKVAQFELSQFRARTQHNLSRMLRSTLNILRIRKEFIIVHSDKNLGPVLMLRDQYLEFCLSHLRTGPYQRVHQIPLNGMIATIRRFHTQLLTALPVRSKEFKIIVHQLDLKKTNRFYGLMKLHKNPIGLRPIVSNAGGPLYGLSVWLDVQLQPYVRSRRSYLKNSDQLLSNLAKLCVTDGRMYTLDVQSLYTSIPLEKALQAVQYFIQHDPLCEFIIQGLKIVMQWNFFEFGDIFFKQTEGTAMGSPVAPAYANLYLAYFEEQVIIPRFATNIILYKRYIDDVIMIWRSLKPYDFNEFRGWLHKIPGLSWTFKFHEFEAPFLDLTIYRGKSQFATRTHEKQLNLHLYIPYRSAHPPGNLKGLVIGLIRRYQRQNTDLKDLQQCVKNLFVYLLQRGYHRSTLQPMFTNALTKSTPKRNTEVFIQVPFNPNGPNTSQLRNLLQLPKLEALLIPQGIPRIRICYLKPSSLRQLLCSTSISNLAPTPADLWSDYDTQIQPPVRKTRRISVQVTGPTLKP